MVSVSVLLIYFQLIVLRTVYMLKQAIFKKRNVAPGKKKQQVSFYAPTSP